jgi:hypothetical protein
VLFSARFREPVARGDVTQTFRRWKRRQVRAGGRYRTNAGYLEVDHVEQVDPATISDAAARAAGFRDAATLRTDLRGDPEAPVFRVVFHPVAERDPRDVLSSSDVLTDDDRAEIGRRLDRLDRTSSHGPWTRAALRTIRDRPGVRAGDLAAAFGRETQPFKLDVRKLKNLGLTLSLEVGYRLSPRGQAYLEREKAGSGNPA